MAFEPFSVDIRFCGSGCPSQGYILDPSWRLSCQSLPTSPSVFTPVLRYFESVFMPVLRYFDHHSSIMYLKMLAVMLPALFFSQIYWFLCFSCGSLWIPGLFFLVLWWVPLCFCRHKLNNLWTALGSVDILTVLSLPTHECQMSLSLSSFIILINISSFTVALGM